MIVRRKLGGNSSYAHEVDAVPLAKISKGKCKIMVTQLVVVRIYTANETTHACCGLSRTYLGHPVNCDLHKNGSR